MSFDIRENIIRPALQLSYLWDENSEMLVFLTGIAESGYTNLKQVSGPALSYWQIEPDTHTFLKEYLEKPERVNLKSRILSACEMIILPSHHQLVYNMRYAAIMCRVRYLNAKPCIPFWNDAVGMAEYHAKWYNRGGKADVEKNTILFQKIIDRDRIESWKTP